MMENGTFWVAASVVALGVLAVLVQALRRGSAAPALPERQELRIFRDQLAEIDRDVARGTLPEPEAARLRTEVSRRLLEADRSAAPAALRNGNLWAAYGIVAIAVAAGIATYGWLGVPGYPDLPLATRLQLADRAYADRLTQAEAEAQTPPVPARPVDPAFADLMTKLRRAMQDRPGDLRGLELLARNEAALGNYGAARTAQSALLAAKGAAATAEDHASLAEVMILAAGGRVTPEAEQALMAALAVDPANGAARYYSGLLFAQVGRPDRTFALWRPLLEDSPPDAPWVAAIRADILAVAQAAGQRYSLPDAGGPSAEALAAAADMAPEDRQAMIEGMVGQLADRLGREGGPATDWARLITSLAVLNQTDRARAILSEARQRFAASPPDAALIEEAAVAAGLAP